MKKLIITAVLSTIIIGIFLNFYDKKEQTITLKEIMQVESKKVLDGELWYVLRDPNDYYFKEIGLSSEDIDFKKNYLIVSEGRKIKEMYFVRSGSFPFRKTHFAEVVFDKELDSHTWFVYKINKMEVYMDERYKNGNSHIEQ